MFEPVRDDGAEDGSRRRPDTPRDVPRWEPEPVGLTKHERAVRRSLAWADEAATQSDFVSALEWLAAIRATGEEIPREYIDKQNEWTLAALGATP